MNNRINYHTMLVIDNGLTLTSQRYGALRSSQSAMLSEIMSNVQHLLLIYTDLHTTGDRRLMTHLEEMRLRVYQQMTVVTAGNFGNLNREQASYLERMWEHCQTLHQLMEAYVQDTTQEVSV